MSISLPLLSDVRRPVGLPHNMQNKLSLTQFCRGTIVASWALQGWMRLVKRNTSQRELFSPSTRMRIGAARPFYGSDKAYGNMSGCARLWSYLCRLFFFWGSFIMCGWQWMLFCTHALNPLVQGRNHTLSLIGDRTEKSWHKSNSKQTFMIKALVTADLRRVPHSILWWDRGRTFHTKWWRSCAGFEPRMFGLCVYAP